MPAGTGAGPILKACCGCPTAGILSTYLCEPLPYAKGKTKAVARREWVVKVREGNCVRREESDRLGDDDDDVGEYRRKKCVVDADVGLQSADLMAEVRYGSTP
jgi:hypothetical protein